MVKKTEVGSPMNFRGFMYQPINEQGVVYLFGLVAENLFIRVESIQQGYPDCTGLKFVGNGRWERVRIEFEHKSSNFDHDPAGCDIIVCWEDDLTQKQKEEMGIIKNGIEIIALKDRIKELPNEPLKDPDAISKQKYTLQDHFNRVHANENVKQLFSKLDGYIKKINPEIWDKYSKVYITYYSPDKLFVDVGLRKNGLFVEAFTDTQDLSGFRNTPFHENWGKATIHNEQELLSILPSLNKSFNLIKQAEKEGKNTGWYALTPPEKMTWNDKSNQKEQGLEEEEEKKRKSKLN